MTKNWDEFKYEVKRSKVKVIVDDNAARGLGNRLWRSLYIRILLEIKKNQSTTFVLLTHIL